MKSLWEFYQENRPRNYIDGWHLKWICKILERAYLERKNVIIECPPRHSKSELVNVYGPAWHLENGGFDENFMVVTNSDNLAKKFSIAARNLVKSPLVEDRDAQWKLAGTESLNYSYFAAGVRGQMTGHGASVLVFDDILKSGAEAMSETIREGTWDNICSASINRLSPNGIIIGLQARLHRQDSIGKLLDLEHLKFLHLHLPATNDCGTKAFFRDGYSGEETRFPSYSSLWPARYSREKLDEIRATVSSYYFQAQYMAEPTFGDMALFDMASVPKHQHPIVERVWFAVDCAQTATANGSYTAMVALGFDGTRLKLINAKRGRWKQDEMHSQVLGFYEAIYHQTGIYPEQVIVESAAAGFGVIDMLSSRIPIMPVYPKGSKEERAGAVCSVWNRGGVSIPESNPSWLAPLLEEVSQFPLGARNDFVDALVHALSYIFRASEFKHQEVELGGFVYNAIEAASFEDDGPTLSNDIPWFGVY